MKFKIKYADQIVGFFSLVGIIGLFVLIFSIGVTQKWFQKKFNYYTIIDNSNGMAVGKDLTYKGFSIGKVKSISLEGSMVRVDYYILADYSEYIREYSLVEVASSPLGSSFVFHPGNGDRLIEGDSEIFRTDSPAGLEYIKEGKIIIEGSGDSIAQIIAKVMTLTDNVNNLLTQINEAFAGSERSEIGKVLKNIDGLIYDVDSVLSGRGNGDLNKILSNVTELLSTINNEGVPAILGEELSASLETIIKNLENISVNASHLVSGLDPQVPAILAQVDSALVQLRDILSGVKNIGIIKKGVEEHSGTNTSTVQLRSMEF